MKNEASKFTKEEIEDYSDQIKEGLLVNEHQAERLIEMVEAFNKQGDQQFDTAKLKQALSGITKAKKLLEECTGELPKANIK